MILLEILAPPGALDGRVRQQLGERLVVELTAHDGMSPDLQEASQALWHVVFEEPQTWITRGRPAAPLQPPRYFVRLTVPSGSHPLTFEVRDDYISRITRVLTDVAVHGGDRDVHADVVVHIVELPEGSFGTHGRAMTTADVAELVAPDRLPVAATPVEPGAVTAVDPICGMTVDLTDDPVLLTIDDETWAFCGDPCRRAFAARHRPRPPRTP